jgi:hypothetical protein
MFPLLIKYINYLPSPLTRQPDIEVSRPPVSENVRQNKATRFYTLAFLVKECLHV